MSFSTNLKKYLTDKGMFDTQADQVIEQFKSDPQNESMAGRWDDSENDYPIQMTVDLIACLNRFTLAWIEENLPQAWFKLMFLSEDDRNAILNKQ